MPSPATELLARASEGDGAALQTLLPLVYQELRGLAQRYIAGERPGHTLQPTALVHEAYLRLTGDVDLDWRNRGHFVAIAARAMRQILINHAKRRGALKHGGEQRRVPLDETVESLEERAFDLLALDEALDELTRVDPELCKIIELRFFAGLTMDEAAEALGTSRSSVTRGWNVARAWLRCRIGEE